MQNKKNQVFVGSMIQRCHKWRQKRKQYMDQARTASDQIERERFLQCGEHYGRIVSEEQGKIDSKRDIKDKIPTNEMLSDDENDDDSDLPEFISSIK